MLWDGSSSIQLLSSELESSCGRKATQLMLQRRRPIRWYLTSLTPMPTAIEKSWLFPPSREESQRRRSSLEPTIPRQWRYMSQPMEEEFKEPPPISWARILQKCSMFGLKTNKARNNLSNKLLGATQLEALGPWSWSMVITRVSCSLPK